MYLTTRLWSCHTAGGVRLWLCHTADTRLWLCHTAGGVRHVFSLCYDRSTILAEPGSGRVTLLVASGSARVILLLTPGSGCTTLLVTSGCGRITLLLTPLLFSKSRRSLSHPLPHSSVCPCFVQNTLVWFCCCWCWPFEQGSRCHYPDFRTARVIATL